MKQSNLPIVYEFNPTVDRVKALMRKAGKRFGSVQFNKRSDGKLRKMCYRLGVTKPTCATAPSGNSSPTSRLSRAIRNDTNRDNTQMTVLDANKVVRDSEGNKIGRGAYRTVPLENVSEICADGVRYKMIRE